MKTMCSNHKIIVVFLLCTNINDHFLTTMLISFLGAKLQSYRTNKCTHK